MSRISIAEFESRLSEFIQRVRLGHKLTLLDGGKPVARVLPIVEAEMLHVREPLDRSSSLRDVPLPPPIQVGFDVVDILLEDRGADV